MAENLKNNPLVSVIVPAYNADFFIGETLKSVLSQTYKNLEAIVVDDGSKDYTPAIVQKFIRRDERVKLFRQQNKGVAAARNLGIEKSSGEFIAPVDSDDIWFPTKIEKQVLRLQQCGPQAGLCYTWSLSIDEKGDVLDTGPQWDLEGEVYQPLVLRNFIGNASVPMFRRSVLEQVGGYNEKLRDANAQGCEDWEISLRIAEKFQFCLVPEYLVGYRCYAHSMSYNHEAMGQSYELIMREVQAKHPEIPSLIHRWSRSIFYLYLTHKSNACGDLRNSLKWLLKALREDPVALCLPWVVRCLLNRLLRLAAYTVTQDERVWRQLRRQMEPELLPLNYEQVMNAPIQPPNPLRFWDRIQVRRWAWATNYRSYAC